MRVAIIVVLCACSIPDKHFVEGDGGSSDAAPPGSYVWIRSMSSMTTYGVAAGAGGNVLLVGGLSVPADLGGGLLTPTGGVDMVVAALGEADGAYVYSRRHGDTGNEFSFLDVADSMGSPIVYGLTGGSPYDVGLGSTTSGGQTDGYIGRYGAGAPAWVHRLHGPLDDKFNVTARGAGSTVYAAGWFEGTATWNGGTVTAAAGRDIFLARFNTFTGAIDLSMPYGTKNREEASGAAPVAGGGLVLAGMFDNLIDADDNLSFGGTSGKLASNGALDVFVAKLDASGAGVWAVSFGGIEEDRDPRVATDANGDVYVTATFRDKIMLGTTMLTSNGGADVFVAKLRGTDGSVVWVKSYGGDGDDGVRGIATDDSHVVVTGWAVGALAGGTTLGGVDAVLVNYDAATGEPRWQKVFSTAGDDRGWSTVFGVSGDILACANLGGAYDFGVPVTGSPAPASVVLRIVP